MQVSTGNVYESVHLARLAGVPDHDLVEVRGTREQVDELSRAVKGARALDAKKARRRQQQRSRRANRGR